MSFKRFLVTDLFFGSKNLDEGEWIDVSTSLPDQLDGIFKVRLDDGSETTAYFYQDKIGRIMESYSNKPSYWCDKKTKEPLYNVVSWKGKLNDS